MSSSQRRVPIDLKDDEYKEAVAAWYRDSQGLPDGTGSKYVILLAMRLAAAINHIKSTLQDAGCIADDETDLAPAWRFLRRMMVR